MGDCNCECPSGDYGCSCCCASVTGLRAGIHPDYIKSKHVDIHINDQDLRTYASQGILAGPIHIISVTASLACIKRDDVLSNEAQAKVQIQEPNDASSRDSEYHYRAVTPAMFSLFTIDQWVGGASGTPGGNELLGGWNPHEDTMDGRTFIATGSLTSFSPSWQSPPDLFGYFCDGGLFVEMNAPTEESGIRIVVNYIDRNSFSPAFGDPVRVLQHYWTCANSQFEFLEGFYGGVTYNLGSSGSNTTSSGSSKTDTQTDPFESDS